MPDVTAADMCNGLCTAMEGESRPAASRDQVVVRARGEFDEITGTGRVMRGEVMSL